MPSNISDFISYVGENGTARPNRYWVKFDVPQLGSLGNMAMYCRTASMPGRSFQTVMQRQLNVPFKIPYVASYDDVSFTFSLSDNLKERIFFEKWQALMYDENSALMNYYDTYRGTTTIEQLDRQDNATYSILLREAYPVALSNVDYAYDNNDTLQQMTVTIAYRYWTNQGL